MNEHDRTLHHAARNCNGDDMQAAIYEGASVSSKDSDGNTPLHEVIQAAICYRDQLDTNFFVELIHLLLMEGADPRSENHKHESPFHMAIDHQLAKPIIHLLDNHCSR